MLISGGIILQIKRLSALDSLRGIAAIGIAFFWHYYNFTDNCLYSQKLYWIYHYGYSFVDLFFVLSGFVFCYVYKLRIINKELSLKKYAILRFSRLYPLMFITLMFVTVVQALRMSILNNFFRIQYNCIDVYHFLLNIFCIQGIGFESNYSFNGTSWSISCEIIAYILFYIFIFKYSGEKKYYIAYIIMILIGLTINKTQLKYPILNQNMSRVYIGFFVGCFTYELNEYLKNNKYKNKILLILSSTLLVTITIASIYGHEILGNWLVVYTILFYPIIILLSLNVSIINKILSIKPLVYLGNLSFSIYLWNFPTQLGITTINDMLGLNINYSSKGFFFVFIAISLMISALSYELIEKRLNKYFKNKLLVEK